ncbi:MAG: response regulator [Magnetococcales bacterium]|nr:response regulator [Magnetococcales bacterium]
MTNGLEKQRILIVDDIPGNIKTLQAILDGQYKLSVATNGQDALKIVAAMPVNLILLDIVMPGMDGFEVCKRLKSDHATKDIPVIFITTRNATEDSQKGFALGAVDYIPKPFVPQVVLSRVDSTLGKKLSAADLPFLI